MKILFVCHGNICRSPMAEYVLKDMVRKAGREDEFEIDSAATTREEIGNDIYPPAKRCLDSHNIPYESRRARQITLNDMACYDLIIAMDQENLYDLRRMFHGQFMEKVHLLMDYVGESRDVADPWYTRDFEETYIDIKKAVCNYLL